jgi:hypothetical protein
LPGSRLDGLGGQAQVHVMCVVMLSDHPGDRVVAAVRERERLAVEQDAILAAVEQDRQKARSEGHWLSGLRLWFAVRREREEARVQHARAHIRSPEEESDRAGAHGEQLLEDGLRDALPSGEWVLFRGYDGESEIDGLLLGPRGLAAPARPAHHARPRRVPPAPQREDRAQGERGRRGR